MTELVEDSLARCANQVLQTQGEIRWLSHFQTTNFWHFSTSNFPLSEHRLWKICFAIRQT